jgi:hypothetical protein
MHSFASLSMAKTRSYRVGTIMADSFGSPCLALAIRYAINALVELFI